MKHTSPDPALRRLTLLPVSSGKQRPAIRRYKLGRVISDLGPALAQTPSQGVRSP